MAQRVIPQTFLEPKRHDVYAAIDVKALEGKAKGKVVVVTGAGRGIGRAIATRFAQAGASQLVISSRTASQLESVAKEIEKVASSCKVHTVSCDVTDAASVDKLLDDVGGGDKVDILVNNAGYLEANLPIHLSGDSWWKTWEANVKGTWLPTRAVLRGHFGTETVRDGSDWVEKRPESSSTRLVIVNISSTGSHTTRPGFSGYQPTKTAVNRFTHFIDTEYGACGVKAFAIHPGGVMTDLAGNMPKDTHHMLKDTPELCGGFVPWLATTPEADFLSGRYVPATWDVDELLAKRDEIVKKDLLKTEIACQ